MDYTLLASDAKKIITEFGTAVTVNRLGSQVSKTTGVFIESVAENVTGDTASSISGLTNQEKVLMMPPSTKKPQVGDEVVTKLGTFRVMKVEEVNPAGITIAFKATMT